MSTRARDLSWKLYYYKNTRLLKWGFEQHRITLYSEELIEKLRNISYGGIPASILLLCNKTSNGYCFDRALLLAQAFLDTDDDVQLVYALIDGLRLNPAYEEDRDDPDFAKHCFVERITTDGKHIIYDTSTGMVYDRDIYWQIEHPKVLHINGKKDIIEFLKTEEFVHDEDMERDKYIAPIMLPAIESTYGEPFEFYSKLGVLQREVENYKESINYSDVCKKIREDMKAMGM